MKWVIFRSVSGFSLGCACDVASGGRRLAGCCGPASSESGLVQLPLLSSKFEVLHVDGLFDNEAILKVLQDLPKEAQ
ncbi:hypothetical protein A9978_20700 [Pseudomonas sp. UMC65]|nr:hypothetical protein [Pseudomonas sp. UMC65]MBB1618406.1 hypothetical protein [Pseudomonas sp. UME65]